MTGQSSAILVITKPLKLSKDGLEFANTEKVLSTSTVSSNLW